MNRSNSYCLNTFSIISERSIGVCLTLMPMTRSCWATISAALFTAELAES